MWNIGSLNKAKPLYYQKHELLMVVLDKICERPVW